MNKQTDLQQKHKMANTFHKHMQNLINITFASDEMQLLKYNLHYKYNSFIHSSVNELYL